MTKNIDISIGIKDFISSKKEEIKNKIKGKNISLMIVQVGNNEASNRYIRGKIKDCSEVGIRADWYVYDEDISEADLLEEIKLDSEFYSGVIVQLPLPKHISPEKVALAIPPEKDIDGFHPMSKFKPCTPKGIMDYLQSKIDLEGYNVVIVGRSNLVGRPLAKMMTDANATVTLCHSKTKNLTSIFHSADLIVTAVGKAKFMNCYSLRMPIVDVGINFDENGKMCGDCFNTENRNVTPVPGGVGLLTRVALLDNLSETEEPLVRACSDNIDGQCDMNCYKYEKGCTDGN